ncbi:oligosaccharide flippase family protein [Thermoproteota archaeon]
MGEDDILIKSARGAGILSTQNLITTLISLIFFMFFARILDKFEMGIYGTVHLIYIILTTIGVLGLRSAASRFISYYNGRNEYQKACLTAKLIIKIALASALTIGLSLFALSELLSQLLIGSSAYAYLFKFAAFACSATIIAFTLTGFLQGLHKFKKLAIFRISCQLVRVFLSIILLVIGLGVASIFVGYIALYAGFALLAFITVNNLILKSGKLSEKKKEKPISIITLFRFSIPIMISRLLLYVSDSVDRLVVLNMLGVEVLGAYTVVLTVITSVTLIFAMPIQTALVPGMSQIYAKAGIKELSKSLNQSSRYITILYVPACIGFAVLSPLVLSVLAGSKYLDVSIPLSIIAIGLTTYGYSSILMSALMALGKTSRIAIVMCLAAISEFVLTIFLVPILNVTGAAISRAIMYVLMLGLLVVFSYKIIKIDFDKLQILRTMISSVMMAFILILAVSYFGYNLILTPLFIIVGLVVYGSIMLLSGGIKRKDVRSFAKIIPRGNEFLLRLKFVRKSKFLTRVIDSVLRE